MSEQPDSPAAGPAAWRLHVDVVETVAGALVALAVWTVVAAVVAVPSTYLVDRSWPLLLVPAVGVLGAALNLRARAEGLRERARRGRSVPG